DVLPGLAVVVGDGDAGLVVVGAEGEVDAPRARRLVAPADCDRRVAVAGARARHGPYVPRQAVVLGDDDGLVAAAVLVRQVDRAVRRDLDVAVQVRALENVVGRDAGAEGDAA